MIVKNTMQVEVFLKIGYDSYITGFSFIKLCEAMGMGTDIFSSVLIEVSYRIFCWNQRTQ